jgi:hypothetical protein
MKIAISHLILFCFVIMIMNDISAQKIISIRPVEIEDVLTNPGMGFTTFGRFNGDNSAGDLTTSANKKFNGNLENKNHPMTSIAYFRFDWRVIEPVIDKYDWTKIDNALKIAHERHQTLMLRIAPYAGGPERDVPAWYRAIVGEQDSLIPKWRVNPEDPEYAFYFGRMITEMAKRYDGHPDLEAVDLSIVGFWGEGAGSALLTQKTRESLVNAYTDNFKKTPLLMLLTDEKTQKYTLSQTSAGWRADCAGDLGFWGKDWDHMQNRYPQSIINFGMKDAWKTRPVSFEICGDFQTWEADSGSCQYCQGYTEKDVNYIIDETLKWHMSSFNAKSSSVPEKWQPLIDRWLKKMGYRFVLRNFTYPEYVAPNGKLDFLSWWDNKGVAPCYKKFLLAIRLKNEKGSRVLITDADITKWLPGDNVYDDAVFVPEDLPTGKYDIQIGIIDNQVHEPKVKLAIVGIDREGWYTIGKIDIK